MKIANLNLIVVYIFIVLILTNCRLEKYDDPEFETYPPITLGQTMEAAILQVAFNQQAIAGRSAGILMQQLQEREPMLYYTNYNFAPSFMEGYWATGLYLNSLKHASTLLRLSEQENNNNAEAIARILLAIDFGHATTMFGDLPFSEAIQAAEGNISPRYDTQEEIYIGILDHLDQALLLLNENTAADIASIDVLAQGKMDQWKKLAYGIRARYKLQLLKQMPDLIPGIIDDIDNSFNNVDDQLEFRFTQDLKIPNPLHKFAVERPATIKAGDFMVSLMEENEDPRSIYYYELGSGQGQGYENRHWSFANSRVPVISFSELMFMKAEVLLYAGASDGSISPILDQAIDASMTQISTDLSNSNYTTEHSQLSTFLTQEEKLKHIISEAYISYYGHSFNQVWNNYRRTGYPELISTGAPSAINTSGSIPQRFFYPDAAYLSNEQNVQQAIENQGGVDLGNPLWVFR